MSSAAPGTEAVTLRNRQIGVAAALLLVLVALGWLGWAVLRDLWVLVIAFLQP